MKRKYEGLIILNTAGVEDTVENIVSSVGQEMEAAGVKLEQIDHLGNRNLPYPSNKMKAGYFVNYVFEADPAAMAPLRSKLKLNDHVHLQHYQRA
jgi:small subunit ribosomal protein S6